MEEDLDNSSLETECCNSSKEEEGARVVRDVVDGDICNEKFSGASNSTSLGSFIYNNLYCCMYVLLLI